MAKQLGTANAKAHFRSGLNKLLNKGRLRHERLVTNVKKLRVMIQRDARDVK